MSQNLGHITDLLHIPPPHLSHIRRRCYCFSFAFTGRQNLACLSFAGGRPIPKRRRFYPGYDEDERSSSVRDEVTYRSYYSKQRNAANIASIANSAKRGIFLHNFYYLSLNNAVIKLLPVDQT